MQVPLQSSIRLSFDYLARLRNDQFQNRLEDNLLGTVSDLLERNSEIEAKESNHNDTRQKENNEMKSAKIELLQVPAHEGKKNDNTRAKFIKDPERRLYYYVERRK